MKSYCIQGGVPLSGTYTVNGAKNAALPILAASVLTADESLVLRCPDISDVRNMLLLLDKLGVKAERKGSGIAVDTRGIHEDTLPDELMNKMRSSVFLAGPLIARCGRVVLGKPGGCNIGKRPIDIHLAALEKLGVRIKDKDGLIICEADKMKGADITLPFPSVGATENLMMAALAADGESIIRGAAREPEIRDLQEYLVSCGAIMRGAGTGTIFIKGKKEPWKDLRGSRHEIIFDRIEAGTLLAAAAATGGEIELCGISGEPIAKTLIAFEKAGCNFDWVSGTILHMACRKKGKKLKGQDILTGPYPAYPTDMQPQMLALMTTASGDSVITESIFENRFKFTEYLNRMGADIRLDGSIAYVRGTERLHGDLVKAEDLRGGAALVIAALMADGKTIIEDVGHIDRGYEKLDETLRGLGADVRRNERGEA